MISIKTLVFNPFQVNNYILWDETLECVIIDAACSSPAERNKLFSFIEDNNLKPVMLLSTHAHVDHILGNKAVIEKYNIPYLLHKAGEYFLKIAVQHGLSYGLNMEESPAPSRFIDDNEIITFGNSTLKAIYAPGHADGSLCYYAEQEGFVIVGDVLFSGSIGRTDLPTGNHQLLLDNISNRLFTLPASTVVYTGHGAETTIGIEKETNPFF